MSLKILNESVRSSLRSGVAITCLSQCVEELVHNSIDAGSSCIAVRIDIPKLMIQVVDNGSGMRCEDLKVIGERYATSKCHSLSDLDNLCYHGYRGEALASIVATCGIVKLCTRHCLSSTTYCKIFHHGHGLEVCVSTTNRASVGTTVTIHDIFYNLPVRKKTINEHQECDKVRRVLIGVSLIHPSVSFSLRNNQTTECLLQTKKTDSIIRNFTHIFGTQIAEGLHEVSISHSGFKLSGYISTNGYHNKSYQFLYVNKRLLKQTKLHSQISQLLGNSLIARKVTKQDFVNIEKYPPEFGSPKRSLERFGVYLLNIECSLNEYDISLEPAKTLVEFKRWNDVHTAVELLVKAFLINHNLTLGITRSQVCSHNEELGNVTRDRSPVDSSLGIVYGLHSKLAQRFPIVIGPHTPSTSPSPSLIKPFNSSHMSLSPESDKENNEINLSNTNNDMENQSSFTTDDIKSQPPSRYTRTLIGLHVPMRSPLNSKSIATKLSHMTAASRLNPLSAIPPPPPPPPPPPQFHNLSLQTCIAPARYWNQPVQYRSQSKLDHSIQLIDQSSSNEIYKGTNPTLSNDFLSTNKPLITSTASFITPFLFGVKCCESQFTSQLSNIPQHMTQSFDIPQHMTQSSNIPQHMTQSSTIPHMTQSSNIPQHMTQSSDTPQHMTQSSTIPHMTQSSDIPHMTQSSNIPQHMTQSSDIPQHMTQSSTIPHMTQSSDIPQHMTQSSTIPHMTQSSTILHVTQSSSIPQYMTHSSSIPQCITHSSIITQQSTLSPKSSSCVTQVSNEQMNSSSMVTSNENNLSSEHNEGCLEIVNISSPSPPPLLTCDSSNETSPTLVVTNDRVLSKRDTITSMWKSHVKHMTGQTLYVHKTTGNCTSEIPSNIPSTLMTRDDITITSCGQSYGHCPPRAAPHLSYGYSPILPRPKHVRQNISNNETVFEDECDHDEPEKQSKWRIESRVSSLFNNWTNPAFAGGDKDIINVGLSNEKSSGIKIHSIIHPYKFSHQIFNDIKVLGQVDNKFIACLIKPQPTGTHKLLVLFDQHAVHERIRLEILTQGIYDETGSQTIVSIPVQPPLPISLGICEKRLILVYKKQLETVGIKFIYEGENMLVSAIPLVFMERDISERKRGRSAVAMELIKDLITKQLDLLQSVGVGTSTLPITIQNVLNSQACHGAIKFGDQLTNSECYELIDSLSHCKLPFQCAHGRPSLIPLLDVELLNKRFPADNLSQRIDVCKLKTILMKNT